MHDIFTDLIFCGVFLIYYLNLNCYKKVTFACDYQTVSALTGRAGYTEYNVIELNYVCHLAVSLVIK